MRVGVRPLSVLVLAGRPYTFRRPHNSCTVIRVCVCADWKSPARTAGPASKQQLNTREPSLPCGRVRTVHTGVAWPLVPVALFAPPASADSINYAPGQGADVVKNIAGLAYAALLAFWLFKVIGRRVKRGTTEVLHGCIK